MKRVLVIIFLVSGFASAQAVQWINPKMAVHRGPQARSTACPRNLSLFGSEVSGVQRSVKAFATGSLEELFSFVGEACPPHGSSNEMGSGT
jgi:hypothetical protein